MRSIRKPKAPPVAAGVSTPPVQPQAQQVDEAAQAEQLRTEAADVRAKVGEARTEAASLLEAARTEAERLVAEAEQRARGLVADAGAAERRATDLEGRAGHLAHAGTVRGQAEAAGQRVADLMAEVEQLGEQDAALVRRQAELGEQREDTAAALTGAREAGDVTAVGELRGKLAAVDEVAGVLEGRRQRISDRLHVIGEDPGIGELAQSATRADALRAELRRTLNALDPERPEARADYVADVLRAQLAQALEPEPQPESRHRQTVRTVTDPSTGRRVLQPTTSSKGE